MNRSTAAIKATIRKALESPLEAALTANSIFIAGTTDLAVQWPGFPMNRPEILEAARVYAVVARCVRMSVSYGPDMVIEMGPDGRIEGGGYAEFGIFTQAGTGADINDALAKIVSDAYPYNANLVRDGVNVWIDTSVAGEIVTVDGWAYSPLQANWKVWRV